MNITWSAGQYAADFSFVPQYGRDVAAWLDAPDGASLLDLGCGTGALTKQLAECGYCVLGMDASAEQLTVARESCPELEFVRGDATDFTLPQPVDAVFSNAVLHWIDAEKQPLALACVYRALKPGGQFVFEMGGAGNNAKIHAAMAEVFAKRGYHYVMPFYFPTVGQYAALLEEAGFSVRRAELFERPTPLKGENGLAEWIGMFLKTPLSALPEAERKPAAAEAAESLRAELYRGGVWYADYVRLRAKAVKE